MHTFEKIDKEVERKPDPDEITKRPPLEVAYRAATEAELPYIVGGLRVALAGAFTIIDPNLKNPQT